MSLSYATKYSIASPEPSSSFAPAPVHVLKKQIIEAMTKTAYTIVNEVISTTDHAARLRYAAQVLSGSNQFINTIVAITLNDTNIEGAADATAITDATVSGVVDGTPALLIAAGLV